MAKAKVALGNPRAVFKTQDLFIPSSVVLWGPYHSFLRQVIDLNQGVQMRMRRGFLCCYFLAYKMLNTTETSVVWFRKEEPEGLQHL